MVYASPGAITVSVPDGRPLAIEDPTGGLQALGIVRFDLGALSLFPELELAGGVAMFGDVGYWRQHGARELYVVPALTAA